MLSRGSLRMGRDLRTTDRDLTLEQGRGLRHDKSDFEHLHGLLDRSGEGGGEPDGTGSTDIRLSVAISRNESPLHSINGLGKR
jgi:hypothetical protein